MFFGGILNKLSTILTVLFFITALSWRRERSKRKIVEKNIKDLNTRKVIEDEINKLNSGDLDNRLSKWMRDN